MASPGSTNTAKLATVMLAFRNAIKMFHWSTKSYAAHQTSNGYLGKLDDLTDTIIEVYSATYGRPLVSDEPVRPMVIKDLTNGLDVFAKFLQDEFPKFVNPLVDTHLLNLRDELLSETQRAIYLSTFR